ncbi:neuronal acetylcholine receptor subunit alpha-10-like [Diadema antillarum]|uniref:neuronal acetylcholine receptor subunit alpha-10-like n=1 Tax=Diadema antillarum TaxID=105358 RepID=UPI003A8370FD
MARKKRITISTGRGEKDLINKLMGEYGHKAARPVRDANRPVWVSFRFLPSQIIKFDETQQQLTVMAYMRMSWTDEFLQWNPDDYGGIEVLSLKPSDIWLPDVALYESCSKEFISYQETYVLTLYNGTSDWHFPAIMTSTCKVDVRYFPFDIQLCDLTFGPWSADVTQVEFHTFEVQDDTSDDIFAQNGVWTLESFAASNLRPFYLCCPHNFSEIRYTLRLRRESAFFTKVVVVPSVLLTMLMALTFWSHPDSGEKVTLAISNLLAMILFQQLVADSMPPIGDTTSVLVTFFFIMIALGCGAVVCAVIVLRIYHTGGERQMPSWLRYMIIRRLQRLRRRRHSLPEVVTVAENPSRETKTYNNIESPNGKAPQIMRQSNSHTHAHTHGNDSGSEEVHDNENSQLYEPQLIDHKLQMKARMHHRRDSRNKELNAMLWREFALALDKGLGMFVAMIIVGECLYCMIIFIAMPHWDLKQP